MAKEAPAANRWEPTRGFLRLRAGKFFLDQRPSGEIRKFAGLARGVGEPG